MISICVASYNAVNALKLLHKSMVKHHPDIKFEWVIGDNASTDGAREYAQSFADQLHGFDHSCEHGKILDQLSLEAKGDHILFVDNDVEILGRIFPDATEKVGDACFVFDPYLVKRNTFTKHGFKLESNYRIDPCFALFSRSCMKTMFWPSWSTYVSYGSGEWFDTGSMKFMANRESRQSLIKFWPRDLPVKHWGQISSGFRNRYYGESEPSGFDDRYKQITVRLKEYE